MYSILMLLKTKVQTHVCFFVFFPRSYLCTTYNSSGSSPIEIKICESTEKYTSFCPRLSSGDNYITNISSKFHGGVFLQLRS